MRNDICLGETSRVADTWGARQVAGQELVQRVDEKIKVE